jgi:hypothetical protein
MLLPVFAVVAALWQQPAPRAVASPQQPSAGWDSTRALVGSVGMGVAEVRSALELFRRAVFNAPDGEVLSTADMFHTRCHALDSVSVSAARKVCRSCASKSVQDALNGYRAVLPAVGRVGARCAQQLTRLLRGAGAAQRLRHDVRVIGNPIVAGLIPYERRLETLRKAAGWAPPRARPAPRP